MNDINKIIEDFTKVEEKYIKDYVCNQEIINLKNEYNKQETNLRLEIVNGINILQSKLKEEYWKIFNYDKNKYYDRKMLEFDWIFLGDDFDIEIPCGEYETSRSGIRIDIFGPSKVDRDEPKFLHEFNLNINNQQDSFLTEYGREKIVNEYIKKFKSALKKHYLTKEDIKAEKIKKLELEIERIKNS